MTQMFFYILFDYCHIVKTNNSMIVNALSFASFEVSGLNNTFRC